MPKRPALTPEGITVQSPTTVLQQLCTGYTNKGLRPSCVRRVGVVVMYTWSSTHNDCQYSPLVPVRHQSVGVECGVADGLYQSGECTVGFASRVESGRSHG